MCKAFLPIIDQPQEELTNRTANVKRKTTDKLPDIASDESEEIREPDYAEPYSIGIAGNLFFNSDFSGWIVNICLKTTVFIFLSY